MAIKGPVAKRPAPAGRERSGRRDRRGNLFRDAKAARPPAEISSDEPLHGRSEDAPHPASGQISPSRKRRCPRPSNKTGEFPGWRQRSLANARRTRSQSNTPCPVHHEHSRFGLPKRTIAPALRPVFEERSALVHCRRRVEPDTLVFQREPPYPDVSTDWRWSEQAKIGVNRPNTAIGVATEALPLTDQSCEILLPRIRWASAASAANSRRLTRRRALRACRFFQCERRFAEQQGEATRQTQIGSVGRASPAHFRMSAIAALTRRLPCTSKPGCRASAPCRRGSQQRPIRGTRSGQSAWPRAADRCA